MGMILGFQGDFRVISPKAKKIFGVFFGYWGDFPGASPKATLKSPVGNCFLWWSLGIFRGFGEGHLEKPRRGKMGGLILGFEGDFRVISPKAKKIFGVFFGYWGGFPGASPKASLKSPGGNCILGWLLGNFRVLGEGDPKKPRREKMVGDDFGISG